MRAENVLERTQQQGLDGHGDHRSYFYPYHCSLVLNADLHQQFKKSLRTGYQFAFFQPF